MRLTPKLVSTTALALALAAAPAVAKPPAGGGGGGGGGGTPTAAVSMGDSYISGEAGRWAGNSLDSDGSRRGTDRAYVKKQGGYYDTALTYLDGTDADGCHRSDVAGIHSAGAAALGVDVTVNLACSGAVARNVWRAISGGQSQNGWVPQADQLAQLTATHDVNLIVLSVGGNDIGFSDIIIACTEAWFTSPAWWENHCEPDEQPGVDAALPGAMAEVSTAIDEINAVMAAAGDTTYRIVLRSYGSPIPRGSQNRYSESGWSRWDDGGCPFWNEDSDWARDSLVPQLSGALASVAASKGVDFLDQQDLFEGREVCAVGTTHSDGSPSSVDQEWVRWMNTGYSQGDLQESLHPNAFGQQAAGACLAAMAGAPGDHACTNVAGQPATVVQLTSIP